MDKENKKLKLAIISGAAHAINFKEENPRATEQEIIQYITKESENILQKIKQKNYFIEETKVKVLLLSVLHKDEQDKFLRSLTKERIKKILEENS